MTKSYKTFKQKRKQENYTKLTKKENIRARSYFKLQQIDKKFNLIKENMNIIDLGCAPGGWLQYIDSKIKTGKIIGIDLLETPKHKEFSDNIEIIEDDFDNINDYTNIQFDLVLSDMAPEFSGNYKVDRGRTHKLNLKVLEFCKDHLKKNANCLFKTFEGEDLNMVREESKKIFHQIKEYKPQSSQKKSAETFIICINKK
ncbi:MAG: SAM-dependent methyltransferase [Nanoarchaeota archaeon]